MVMKINLSTIENIEDMRSVPPGDYRCKVAEVRESQSPAGHTRWGIRWEVIKGEFQGEQPAGTAFIGQNGGCRA